MYTYSLVFLIAAVVAGFLGFGIIVGTFAIVARLLLLVFLLAFVVTLIRARMSAK